METPFVTSCLLLQATEPCFKEVYYERKELALTGVNSFFLKLTPIDRNGMKRNENGWQSYTIHPPHTLPPPPPPPHLKQTFCVLLLP